MKRYVQGFANWFTVGLMVLKGFDRGLTGVWEEGEGRRRGERFKGWFKGRFKGEGGVQDQGVSRRFKGFKV